MGHPVLVGAGQVLGARDLAEAREPAQLMAEAAALAAQDAGLPGLASRVDLVGVVHCVSWPYPDPGARVAGFVGAAPGRTLYTSGGGNTPQLLVNVVADMLARGDARVALLCGAEIVYWRRRARRHGVHFDWPRGDAEVQIGDNRSGAHEDEVRHGLAMPIAYYPLFESAIHAASGRTLDAHVAHLGRLFARFNAVAAKNPYAWFPTPYTSAELVAVSPENRMIGFPYPKRLNAVIDVNQAAALLLTTDDVARELGIGPDRCVYLHGAADGHETWYPLTRATLARAPGVRTLMHAALDQAHVTAAEIDAFDIYSCFPSAVQYGLDALGVAAADPRPLTLTGGLPYFGGPANNYAMHAIADMVGHLRARPGARGLVWANGWYATKHAVGVYGQAAPPKPYRRRSPARDQAVIDAGGARPVAAGYTGVVHVVASTVLHDSDGVPATGIAVVENAAGERMCANLREDQLTDACGTSLVGRRAGVTRSGDAAQMALE